MHTTRPSRFVSRGVRTAWLSPAVVGLVAVAALCSSNVFAADLAAPGAELQKLADGFEFTEGPAVDQDGNVYFTDQPNDRIMKWSPDGQLETFAQPCGRSNGLYFDQQQRLLACADEKNQLWRFAADGSHEVLITDYDGKRLNGPNDLWARPDGNVYFTDPFYRRAYWDHEQPEQSGQCVYYWEADSGRVTRVADDLQQPNGLIGTPDGKTLYVADIGAQRTYAYRIGADGSLADKRLFCELGSDGMTIDHLGNVYLTGQGVTVFDRAGNRVAHWDVPERWTANVTFGGENESTLVITASRGLYGLPMQVHGVRWRR